MIVTIFVLVIFLIGCVEYKSYDTDSEFDDTNLIDEIAAIEDELGLNDDNIDELDDIGEDLRDEELDNGMILDEDILDEGSLEEEIILPDLDEEPEEVAYDDDLDVIKVKENELVKLNVKVSDPDEDKVSYTFSQPLNSEGQWQTSYGDAGEYIITVTASDGNLNTEKKIKIVVEKNNVPPVLDKLKDIIVKEGEVVKFTPSASDPNGDEITITVSEPLKDGVFETDHTSAGEYRIQVTASDGEMETAGSFTLTINEVNVLPEISGLSDLTVKEGDIVRIEPIVNDPDGDSITTTIGQPVGNDGIWETDFTDNGEYLITISVSDGKDTVVKKINLVVEDVNKPPVFIGISQG